MTHCKGEPLGTSSARIIYSCDNRDIFQLPVAEIEELFKAAGALVFRGFKMDPWILKSFADQFSSRFNRDRLRPPVEGTGGAVQLIVDKGAEYVEPHSEQANSPFRPDAIWLYCKKPATQKGETLYWDGVRLWEQLSKPLQHLFSTKKIRYFQHYTVERWKLFLGEDATLSDVRQALDGAEGTSYYIRDDQSIYLEYICSAMIKTKYGNQNAFVNGLLTERKNTLGSLMTFEDGSPITDSVITEIMETMQGMTQKISWKAGDLAFIDNSRFMHGRNAFTDPQRQIYTSMSFLNF